MIGMSLTGIFINTVFRLVKKEASSQYLIYRTVSCPRKTIRPNGLIGVKEKLENLIRADIRCSCVIIDKGNQYIKSEVR